MVASRKLGHDCFFIFKEGMHPKVPICAQQERSVTRRSHVLTLHPSIHPSIQANTLVHVHCRGGESRKRCTKKRDLVLRKREREKEGRREAPSLYYIGRTLTSGGLLPWKGFKTFPKPQRASATIEGHVPTGEPFVASKPGHANNGGKSLAS